MQKLATKNTILSIFWMSAFFCVLIFLPGYLGMIIARQQWQMLLVIISGLGLISLYFSNFRYLIICSILTFLFANSNYPTVAGLFGSLRWLLLGTMSAAAVSHWVMGRVPRRFRTIDLWGIAFIALAFYSYTYSIAPYLTLQRSISAALFYLSVFWGVWVYIQDEKNVFITLNDLLKISFVIFLFGFTIGQGDRFVGVFTNPNSIGAFSALVAPLALWSHLCQRKRHAWILVFLIAASLLLSQSRGGLISTVIGSAYFLLTYRPRNRHLILMTFIFLIGAFILYLELFGASSVKEFMRFQTLGTGSGRIEAWKEVLRLIKLRPWTGYGFGTEDQLFSRFDIIFHEHTGAYAHNSYLGLVSQLGLIGAFIFYVPLLLFVAVRTFQIDQIQNLNHQWLQAALNASIIGGLVNAVFESCLYSVGNSFTLPFWILVIFSYRLSMSPKLEPAEPEPE